MKLKNLPLFARLILMTSAVLLVLIGAGLFGVERMNDSALSYASLIENEGARENLVMDTLIEFKTQVQEWKNTLLRGKEPQALDKYWSAFQKHEAKVQEKARQLLSMEPPGEIRDSVVKFIDAHAAMGRSYRMAFEVFKASGFEPSAGDKAVKGLDRASTDLLEKIADLQDAAIERTRQNVNENRIRAHRLTLAAMGVAFIAGLIAVRGIARSVMHELGGEPAEARSVAIRIAQGDLATPVPARLGDSTTVMAALWDMQRSLAAIVTEVRSSSESIETGSEQIASGNFDLSQRTEEQASNLQQTAASMEQLSGTVHSSVKATESANVLAGHAREAALRGGEMVGQVVSTMQDISASSRKIAEIIGVIDGIAFQTNILALNAAVESARAGEQGRGFAVVAGEVRTLAGRSAEAAREIKQLITASVEKVDAGTRQVDAAGQAMLAIVDQVQRVSGMISEISGSSKEQAQGISQVGDAVQQLDQVTQANAALVEETAAAAESLRRQAKNMTDVIARFKLSASA
ncbi:methyl-accepting chemotaxis protein [Ideonella sp. 4Y11]|uniref:Methyl-accepting chemotaxis protein n=1 Tax=Ideonella aquatica TaxID=2824119 RepID=A0A940YHZ2_9BURK|nr:methyl-accepting chemotaxis protein [Ideonella aquatica]MBQ0960588.1 methyl-accepting chemotaxis protein [Ideonella aquatica]